jgi:uroporphyrinogen-III synthase
MCREKLVGVINVQHKQGHFHSRRDIQLISVIGFLIGAEIELARLEAENVGISKRAG